jgi:homoserine kinase
MSSERNHVVVQVPASTSNLGSGFDTLGLAVNRYTRVEARFSPKKAVELESSTTVRPDFRKLIDEAAGAFFKAAARESFGADMKISSDVPIARGLGYSATVRVGVLAALNELAQRPLKKQELLNVATRLEHHPDNASPSIYGGLTVSGVLNGEVRCMPFAVALELKLVTLIPSFPISTEEARKLMPSSYSKADAAHGLNRAALITAAFASGRFEMLRGVFDDRVHQPYREKLIPQLTDVIAAGERAGAIGGFLSGSGSGIICLATEKLEEVGIAMKRCMPDSEVMVLEIDNVGCKVL